MFCIQRSTLEIYIKLDDTSEYHIRHFDKNDVCVAEAFLSEEQAVVAQENNPALKIIRVYEEKE